jgi:hypothetical protein
MRHKAFRRATDKQKGFVPMNFEASVQSMRCHEVCVGTKYALARTLKLDWMAEALKLCDRVELRFF